MIALLIIILIELCLFFHFILDLYTVYNHEFKLKRTHHTQRTAQCTHDCEFQGNRMSGRVN